MLGFEECIIKIKKIKTKSYCLIIGGQGTNNARSPKIWNRVLKKNEIDCKMIPLEVKEKDLNKLLNFLKNDSKFLGGAVAVPYKENIYKYLGNNLDIFTKKIGSVNCLYKEKTLRGINTDGIGFFETLIKNKIDKKLKNVLLLGYGGVGKAALVYLKKYFSGQTSIYCATRKDLSKKINNIGCKWIKWNKRNSVTIKSDMIVNATSIGFGKMKHKIPIDIKKKNAVKIVYDIIYNPKKTALIKKFRKFEAKTINGIDMNLYQAHFAIKKVFNKINLN